MFGSPSAVEKYPTEQRFFSPYATQQIRFRVAAPDGKYLLVEGKKATWLYKAVLNNYNTFNLFFMKPLVQNGFLPAVLSLLLWFAGVQKVQGQSDLHDSLRHLLACIGEKANSETLQKTVTEAKALYTSNVITDSLSKKLLIIDSLLINTSALNQPGALSYAELLVQLFQELTPRQEHPDYASSLDNLAVCYRKTGWYEKSIPHFQQALAIRKKMLGEEHLKYATTLYHLGSLYYDMGHYEKVLPLDQQALAIIKKTLGEDHPDYAEVLSHVAIWYSRVSQFEKALPLYQQSLAIIKKTLGKESARYASILHNLAILYFRVGQYEKAQPLYEQTLAIYKKTIGEEDTEYAVTLNNLAVLYTETRRYEKALPLFEQCLVNYKKALGDQHFRFAISLFNLGDLYFAMGQYGKALPLYERALEIHKKTLGKENPYYGIGLSNVANLFFATGQYRKALPLYEESLAVNKRALGAEHPRYAFGLNNLALVYTFLGNLSLTSDLLVKASAIVVRHLGQTYTTLSEQEKLNFLKNKSFQFNYLPSVLFTQRQRPSNAVHQLYANELALKGMVLEDQKSVLNSIRKSGDSSTLQLYEQWRLAKANLIKQFLLPVSKRLPYVDSLQEATNSLEQQLSRRAASFQNLQRSQAITVNDISRKLLKGEAAVEFIRFNLYNKKWTDSTMYAALVLLPGDSIARFVPLFEERVLQRILKPYSSKDRYAQYVAINKLYGKGSENASGITPQYLYKLLWQPLEGHLAGVHTIYYAPAGLLHRIAFGALRPNATHLLIDRYQLRQVLSTRAVALPTPIAQKPGAVMLWGNINYNSYPSVAGDTFVSMRASGDTTASSFNFYTDDTRGMRGDNWETLPGAKWEIDSLGILFQRAGIAVTIDSSEVATEEAFKALSGRSRQVVHLATHGFFLPVQEKKPKAYDDLKAGGNAFTLQENPMFRSGLVLAGGNHAWRGEAAIAGKEDGILTAYEIAQLDLSNTDVVVLSACESALGDVQGNEGVIGLQRAFKMAGVKQLVMSLWRVPDKETMELMTLFYQNWIDGQSTREALRNAQLKMSKKYSPYYWAAFVVVE